MKQSRGIYASVGILPPNIAGKSRSLVSTAYCAKLSFENADSSCRGYSGKMRFLGIAQELWEVTKFLLKFEWI